MITEIQLQELSRFFNIEKFGEYMQISCKVCAHSYLIKISEYNQDRHLIIIDGFNRVHPRTYDRFMNTKILGYG